MSYRSIRTYICTALSIGLLLILSVLTAWAQGRQPQPKPPQTKQAPPAPKKAGTEASCDGALEIVPSQPMSFVRKRRVKAEPAPTDTKAEKKKAGEAQ